MLLHYSIHILVHGNELSGSSGVIASPMFPGLYQRLETSDNQIRLVMNYCVEPYDFC